MEELPNSKSSVVLSQVGSLTSEEAASLLDSLNGTLSADLACELTEMASPSAPGYCATSFDRLICWPSTSPHTMAILPCLAEIKGIKYNAAHNVSRWCHSNGTWDYTDYSACEELHPEDIQPEVEITTTIYFVGYANSLIALVLATWIFLYFKDLRCLRNVIHMNLMCTYILTDFTWILSLTLQMNYQTNMTTCIFFMILLHYFHLTNFFWMFVEGLYLYMLVVKTFTSENIKLRLYATIGWGGPIIFVLSWALVKSFAGHGDVQAVQVGNEEKLLRQCPWMRRDSYDWIYQAPAVGILLINLVFLFIIMWVLITKLRSAQTVETQQYRKAAKALLVLIPLLGITYVLFIAGPSEGLTRNIHKILQALLISTQGFTVALFYCFLNTEVQNTLRHHIERWRTARSFRFKGSRRYTYAHSKDWSPRSRTESIRLYNQSTNIYHKRESTASEATTTTLVNVNGSQARSPFLQPGHSHGHGLPGHGLPGHGHGLPGPGHSL